MNGMRGFEASRGEAENGDLRKSCACDRSLASVETARGKLAFLLTLDDAGLEVVRSGARSFVHFVIGIDPDDGIVYTLTISLDFGMPGGIPELSFWIGAEYGDGRSDIFWNGAETHFISRGDRTSILQALLSAVESLVVRVRPERALMMAVQANPSERAIRKYLKISDIFRKHGYTSEECEEQLGIRSWLMERSQVG